MPWFKRKLPQPKTPAKPSYRAVIVEPREDSCAAAKGIEDIPFLTHAAPSLPLEACDRVLDCPCRYRHRADRRTGPRRDTDHGLPARYFEGTEQRRGRRDRRVSTASAR